jgi:hypothetical protein
MMQSHSSVFQEIFAPTLHNGPDVLKDVLDALALMCGVLGGYFWNVGT